MRAIGFIEFFKSPAPLTKILFREKRVQWFNFGFLIKKFILTLINYAWCIE